MSEKSAGNMSRAEEGKGQVTEEEKEKGNIHQDVCSHSQCHCGSTYTMTNSGYKMDNVRSVVSVILMQVFIGFLIFIVQHYADEVLFKQSMTTAKLTTTTSTTAASTIATTTLTTAAMAGTILPINTNTAGLQFTIAFSKKLKCLMDFVCQKSVVSEIFVISRDKWCCVKILSVL